MKIFQIIIGGLPQELVEYVESVKSFAERNGHSYRVITEVPEKYITIQDARIISNNMRIDELCKDTDACYFDWDVLLPEEFNFTTINKPKFSPTGDVIIYSGNTSFWSIVRNWMGEATEHPYELGRIFNALNFCGVKITPDMIIPRDGWKHMHHSGYMK